MFSFFVKVHVRQEACRGYSYFHLYIYVFIYVFIYLFICVTPPGQMKNDTDLKYGTHAPIDLILSKNGCFVSSKKNDPEGLEKLFHVDFLQISSIAFLNFFISNRLPQLMSTIR